MRSLIKTVLILLFLTNSSNAETFGKTYTTSNIYDACMRNAQSSHAHRQCMNEELKRQDSILNKNYKEAMKSIQGFRRKKLRKTQRAWIKYRDLKCSSYYHVQSGSGGVEDALQCRIRETIKRADELTAFY